MNDLGDRGRILHLPEIAQITGMPEATIRSKYHGGTMRCVWKLGRRLVVWEKDLRDWLDQQRIATTKPLVELFERGEDDQS
jgi:predicted DNA-binding transcriptional regulator AlpA